MERKADVVRRWNCARRGDRASFILSDDEFVCFYELSNKFIVLYFISATNQRLRAGDAKRLANFLKIAHSSNLKGEVSLQSLRREAAAMK